MAHLETLLYKCNLRTMLGLSLNASFHAILLRFKNITDGVIKNVSGRHHHLFVPMPCFFIKSYTRACVIPDKPAISLTRPLLLEKSALK